MVTSRGDVGVSGRSEYGIVRGDSVRRLDLWCTEGKGW